MTETPPMLAETPDIDVITDVLAGVRLTASVFMDGRFAVPFGVISPVRWDNQAALSRLRHVSTFHLVAKGNCTVIMPDGSSTAVSAGDMLLIPFTPEHRFWSGDFNGFAFGPDLLEQGPIAGVAVVRHCGDGPPDPTPDEDRDEVRLVCGFLESAELLPAPFFRTLPPLIVERASDDAMLGPIAETAATILKQLEAGPSPAAQTMLARLMELLFIELLRRHASRLPDNARGVFAASRDPLVSKALTLLHRDPMRKWTVESLAEAVGASRSVLGDRFAKLLDMPPIEYLTGWRMQLACERLRNGKDALVNVAADVGYDSEAAFSRAFRRVVGISPGAWRQAA